jgi:hypothetical protein
MAFPQSLIDESEADQNAILRFSTGSRRVIAKHSGHFVHIDRPDVVEREVVDFIDVVNAESQSYHRQSVSYSLSNCSKGRLTFR